MENQEEALTKLCSNCKRDIPSINYVMHQNHCQRNIKLCEHCKEPVPRSEMEAHFEEEHKKVPCKCGESIEKCQLEEHEAKHCMQRSVKCEYCEIDLPYAKIGEHKNFCGSRTELCSKCTRYIQLKDLDVHTATECTYPEAPPQPPKSKQLSHMDHFDGLNAAVLSGWPATWDNNMQFLARPNANAHRSASDLYDLASPPRPRVWNPQVGLAQNRRQTGREGAPDRRHRKNQDRVQNSFGVTSKKVPGSSSDGGNGNGPWEKNQERQQNLSQEESDRLLAMHLAQDLRGSGEHPAFRPTSQDMSVYDGSISEAEIDQILKAAYDIPPVNTYQEPKFTQSSPPVGTDTTDASSMLPCEFCQESFPPDMLIEHESGCRPDVVSFPSPPTPSTNNNRQHPSHGLSIRPHVLDNLSQDMSPEWLTSPESTVPARKPSVDVDEDNTVMLPCEFCGDLLPSEFLSHHQVNCTENGSLTPAPPVLDLNSSVRNLNRFSPSSSPTRPRPRRIPAPTSLDLHPRPVKHQADPNLDVLMVSPDSKPTKDETSPGLRHLSQPRSRKAKVTSTVTRPGGHGVNLAITPSPVDKYLNGSPYDRDLSNGGMVAKPRVVTVERKVRGERPHNIKSSSRVQHSSRNFSDLPSREDNSSLGNDLDEDVTPLFSSEPGSRSKGKSTKKSSHTPTSPSINDLNNKQRQAVNLRTKPFKKTGADGEEVLYQPSFVSSHGERRKGSRDKNSRYPSNKPSNRSKQSSSSASVVNLEPDDDFTPLRLSKSSNHSTSGAKPKQKKRTKKPDDDIL